ncbi:MAG: PadR family transcriptional regulator [Leptolinea sp.]|nr:PadR family transcriptional regulator [Leptolinea sp.]
MDESQGFDRKFQKELHAGITSLILLAVLDDAEEPMYGYQIARLLGEGQAETRIKQGVLYPALRSLESSGLLTSIVEPSVSGPPRRYYQITPAGVESLRRWRTIWQHTKIFVDSVVRSKKE